MKHAYLAALAVLAFFAFFLFAACGPTSSGGHGQPGDDDDAPPVDDDLTPVADDDATPADDDNEAIFAVGDNGTILHYEGSTWSAMESGTTARLWSIWGASRSAVYVVGDIGLLHYDGSAWSNVQDFPGSPINGIFNSIWGTGSANVFVTGAEIYAQTVTGETFSQGIILHYDGVSWSIVWRFGAFYLGDFEFGGVWGSSPSDVFVLGDWQNYDLLNPMSGFVVAHFNGRFWAPMYAATNVAGGYGLSNIWGTSHSDVFAVGDSGYPNAGDLILHYDGASWSAMPAPAGGAGLVNVWGTSATDVFSVGGINSNDYVLQYNGAVWRQTLFEQNLGFVGLWGTAFADVFASGCKGSACNEGVIYHYNGSSWSPMNIGTGTPALAGIWGAAP